MTIEIGEPMAAPIFVYYQLTNFYQNHRRYVKSRSYTQLMGYKDGDDVPENVPMTSDEVGQDCEPIIKNSDLENMGITTYYGGYTTPRCNDPNGCSTCPEANPDDCVDDEGNVWSYSAGLKFSNYEQQVGDSMKNGADLVATPCGLIAKSMFTDSYELYKDDNGTQTRVEIDEKGIAW